MKQSGWFLGVIANVSEAIWGWGRRWLRLLRRCLLAMTRAGTVPPLALDCFVVPLRNDIATIFTEAQYLFITMKPPTELLTIHA